MVNIIDDDIWNAEPALRPEDEILLRKLHDMLQSTADDLKLLSGELAKFHEPRVQEMSHPTPLDEDFNEKVHIEELVNAKFHGYKIIDKTLPVSPESKPKKVYESLNNKPQRIKATKVNAGVQVTSNLVSSMKKTSLSKNLQITRPKIVQIKEDPQVNSKGNLLNNGLPKKDRVTVHYNEFSYKYDDPKDEALSRKSLQIQKMPVINIRSELKQQKVLQLDIMPVIRDEPEKVTSNNNNVGVISVQHESSTPLQHEPLKTYNKSVQSNPKTHYESRKPSVRKVYKMSTCESSESTNNVSSDAQHRLDTHKQIKLVPKPSPKSSARKESKNQRVQKKEQEKRPHFNLDEWKKKLNAVYGQPSTSKKGRSTKQKKLSPKKSNLVPRTKPKPNLLNNAEYIPYSQLTLGGVRVSDIERELSEIPNKNDIPLSPILDKILSSRENSFHKDSPRKHSRKDSPKVLTTSDENLLQEVIDIEKAVSKTLAKNLKDRKEENVFENMEQKIDNIENDEENSYVDDFEDDKSDQSAHSEQSVSNKSPMESLKSNGDGNMASNPQNETESDSEHENPNTSEANMQNATYTKVLNLSFKNSVDVFEFVHSIDTQDTGTQSNTTNKISLKETQTSPRNEKSNIHPIHNDLWPSIDPKGEVENLFELEKDFIKKLILEEYGDILEKNINKPSTSNDNVDRTNNVAAYQKNTQTSPAHVKSVMTSPTRTKTRTTSPFSLSVTVDRQTSPMIQVTNEEELKIEIANEAEDLGISINLSSPRFSLRLPQTSREVLSNLDRGSRNHSIVDQKETSQGIESKTFRKYAVSSSSSVDADNSSSEISSLGEVKLKLKRKLKKNRVSSLSESSGSSMISRYSSGLVSGDILPLKSEGEVTSSLGQVIRKPRRKRKESDGEMNL